MSRLLPSEEGDHTVYVIDFYDRCKYFGYTREFVFYRADCGTCSSARPRRTSCPVGASLS